MLGGDGRLVTFDPPIPMEELEGRIKKNLSLSQSGVLAREVGSPHQQCGHMRWCWRSLFSGMSKSSDVWFTGELEHHDVLAALASGTHVILCGHTNTERGYLPTLVTKLQDELKAAPEPGLGAVEVIISQADAHPLQFV
ncbi:GTP cyclohydrolase 1 type 2/Nif3 [Mycena haematopus]|nr:GTP cyclohydrolase 1 type 2/Nif3 [Mycena haematopus]